MIYICRLRRSSLADWLPRLLGKTRRSSLGQSEANSNPSLAHPRRPPSPRPSAIRDYRVSHRGISPASRGSPVLLAFPPGFPQSPPVGTFHDDRVPVRGFNGRPRGKGCQRPLRPARFSSFPSSPTVRRRTRLIYDDPAGSRLRLGSFRIPPCLDRSFYRFLSLRSHFIVQNVERLLSLLQGAVAHGEGDPVRSPLTGGDQAHERRPCGVS